MVKGISRRVIIIKSPDPEIFDEAIFLVKEEAFSKGKTKSDVLRQAQSVANEYIRDSVTKKKKKTIQDNKNNTPGILSEDLMLTTFREK